MFENIRKDYLKVLFVFLIASSIISISQTVVTTAIVHIMNDFHVSSAIAQWAYSIFLLTLGVVIPLNAFISRRFKAKRIYLFCITCFMIGSLICYLSFDIMTLLIGRILQAVSFGIMMPYTQIILLKIAPEEQWQMFMSIYGIILAVVPVLGLVISGYIIDIYGWKNIFSMFIILGMLALILGLLYIKIDFDTEKYPLDILSAVLSFIGCFGVIISFTNLGQYPFTSANIIVPLIAGLLSLAVFFRRQKNLEKPFINTQILKNKYYTIGVLVLMIAYFMYNGCTALLPIFVQGIAGHDAITTSLIVFPGGLTVILFNFIGPYLATRFSPRIPIIAGIISLLIGHISMMFFSQNSTITYMILSQVIRYIGFGLLFMPMSTWVLTMVPDNSEDGSTLYNTSREISGTIGSSFLVVITSMLAGGEIAANTQSAIAFNQTALILVILSILILIISIIFIKDKERIIS